MYMYPSAALAPLSGITLMVMVMVTNGGVSCDHYH